MFFSNLLESLTEAMVALPAAVEALLDRPLTPYEDARLRDLAGTKRPSAIIPLLHLWVANS